MVCALLGADRVLSNRSDMMVYECDGFVIEKNSPDVVVFPQSTDEVAAIVRLCNDVDVPFLPRGTGTSLAGGCLPVGGGVMISARKFDSTTPPAAPTPTNAENPASSGSGSRAIVEPAKAERVSALNIFFISLFSKS